MNLKQSKFLAILIFLSTTLFSQSKGIEWTSLKYKHNKQASFIGSSGNTQFYMTGEEIYQIDSDLRIKSKFDLEFEKYMTILAHFKVIDDKLHIFTLDKASTFTLKKFEIAHHIYTFNGKRVSKKVLESVEISKNVGTNNIGFEKTESPNGEFVVYALRDEGLSGDDVGIMHIKIPTKTPDQTTVTQSKITASHKVKASEISDLYVSNEGEIISCLKLRANYKSTHGSNVLFIQDQLNKIKEPIEFRSGQNYLDHTTVAEIKGELRIAAFRLTNLDLKDKIDPVHDKIIIGKIDIAANKINEVKEFDFDRKIYEQIGLLDKDGKVSYKTISHYNLRFVHNENKRFLLAERQYRTTLGNDRVAHYHLEIMCFELNNEMEIISQSVLPKASLNTKYGFDKNDYTSNYIATIYNDKLLLVYNDEESNLEKEKLNYYDVSSTFDNLGGLTDLIYAYYDNGSFIRKTIPRDVDFPVFIFRDSYYKDGSAIYLSGPGRFGKITLTGE